MKRSPLQRRTALKRSSKLKRARMKRRATYRRPGADAVYLDWIRRQPCAAPGCTRKPPSEAHHHSLLGAGMARKAPDRFAMPLCRFCHHDLHALRGPFKGWCREQLKRWQDEQCALYQAAFAREMAA